MNQRTLISTNNICYSYKSRSLLSPQNYQVIQDLNMDIKHGERLGIIGGNGSGKSTLLRLLAGVFEPSSGYINVDNIKTSLLSLGLGFKGDLSGKDNAILSSLLNGLDYSNALNILDSIEEFSELGDAFNKPVRTYSSGMRARLTFSIALQTKCELILIDEILSVGDLRFREKANAAISEVLESVKAFVIVSHNQGQIMNLCSRVIWLHNGEIKEEGNPETVIKSYIKYMSYKN